VASGVFNEGSALGTTKGGVGTTLSGGRSETIGCEESLNAGCDFIGDERVLEAATTCLGAIGGDVTEAVCRAGRANVDLIFFGNGLMSGARGCTEGAKTGSFAEDDSRRFFAWSGFFSDDLVSGATTG
jgi:hypothetical protein